MNISFKHLTLVVDLVENTIILTLAPESGWYETSIKNAANFNSSGYSKTHCSVNATLTFSSILCPEGTIYLKNESLVQKSNAWSFHQMLQSPEDPKKGYEGRLNMLFILIILCSSGSIFSMRVSITTLLVLIGCLFFHLCIKLMKIRKIPVIAFLFDSTQFSV